MTLRAPKVIQAGIRDVRFGDHVTLVEPVNIYGCTLGDDCFVGPFVEIQKRVVVGQGTRIQSHTFICEKVTLGKNCFIGHGVMFVNDLFKGGAPDPDPRSWGETRIGDGVTIGSNATILPVQICDGAVIGAGAVVTRDIKQRGIYAGNPARLLRTLP
ncbi:acyltransferase [Dongshaea marina]|uniref:acyltransferase n=1 Tax=Dongshaea marina TaxID=2047966 RepID=UPI000D3ECDD2|nr:acyltransferase [Dongshaea marina]